MKRYLLIVFLTLTGLMVSAQDMKFVNFRESTKTTARMNPEFDPVEGEKCAVIHVSTENITPEERDGLSFQLDNAHSIAKRGKIGGDVLLWVPQGTVRLEVRDKLGNAKVEIRQIEGLSDGLQSMVDYEVNLQFTGVRVSSGPTSPSKPVKRPVGFIVFESDPSGAWVSIDGQSFQKTPCQAKKEYGTYTYSIKKDLYHEYQGSLTLDSSRRNISVKLEPAFGQIVVKSEPQGARVSLDGVDQNKTTPCTLSMVGSGNHKVSLYLDMYTPVEKPIVVHDNATTEVIDTLDARFATITIINEAEGDILVDSNRVGRARAYIDLMEGFYDIEAVATSHVSDKRQIEVVAGHDQTITMRPIPIYGSLEVVSTPSDAMVTIGGVQKGITPRIDTILVGCYDVKVSKYGYSDYEARVTIKEDESTEMNVILEEYVDPVQLERARREIEQKEQEERERQRQIELNETNLASARNSFEKGMYDTALGFYEKVSSSYLKQEDYNRMDKCREESAYQRLSSVKESEAENAYKLFLSAYPKSEHANQVSNLLCNYYVKKNDFEKARQYAMSWETRDMVDQAERVQERSAKKAEKEKIWNRAQAFRIGFGISYEVVNDGTAMDLSDGCFGANSLVTIGSYCNYLNLDLGFDYYDEEPLLFGGLRLNLIRGKKFGIYGGARLDYSLDDYLNVTYLGGIQGNFLDLGLFWRQEEGTVGVKFTLYI